MNLCKYAFALFLLFPTFIFADDTAMNDGSEGPEPLMATPGAESHIQMAEENLVFNLGRKYTNVSANFTFVNTNTQSAVTQLTGFPDPGLAIQKEPSNENTWFRNFMGPLEKMKTKLDGLAIPCTVFYSHMKPDPEDLKDYGPNWKGDLIAWHVCKMIFKPGEQHILKRQYGTKNGGISNGVYFFKYTTLTGSDWKGPIGKMVLDLYLKDGLTVEDIDWSKDHSKFESHTIPIKDEWQILSPNHLKLVWKEFKPSKDESKCWIRIQLMPAWEEMFPPDKSQSHQTKGTSR